MGWIGHEHTNGRIGTIVIFGYLFMFAQCSICQLTFGCLSYCERPSIHESATSPIVFYKLFFFHRL